METTSPAATSPGNVWDSINSGLSSALGLYAQYDAVRRQSSATGYDQVQRVAQPDIPNGAAIQVDEAKVSPANADEVKDVNNFDIGGVKVNKILVMASLGILGAALYFKKFG